MTYYCRAGRWYGKRSVPSPVLSSYLTSPLNKHEPAPSTAFARARPSPPSFGSSGVTPALSIPHKKLRTSGRKPERPLMTDTSLAKIAARAAFSGREESAVTSEPLPETTQDNKNGQVYLAKQVFLFIKVRDTRSDKNKTSGDASPRHTV